MATACSISGCKSVVPAELDGKGLCLPHFMNAVEEACSGMRRETVMGTAARERRKEIAQYIATHGELLARAATSGMRMPDELKARVMNTFLTLMNLRENMDRAAERAKGTIGG